MRQRGWEPREWLKRLRVVSEAPGCIGWRQEVEGTAAGSWFSTLTLKVPGDAPAHVTFQPVAIGQGITYSTREGDGGAWISGRMAHLTVPRTIPETMLATLPGREVRCVVDFDAFGHAIIAQAYRIRLSSATVLEFEPACEEMPLPWNLMP
jgi:hypothetical protein